MTTKNIIISLLALTVLALFLRRDFAKDKGEHKNAKTYHAIILSVLVFSNSTSIYFLLWVILNVKTVASGYTMRIGLVPGSLQFSLFLLKLLCTVAVFILCFLMAQRKEKARKLFFYALPLLCISGLFNFYTNSLAFGNGFGMAFPSLLIITLLVYLGLTTLTLFVYRSPFMKAFFHTGPETSDDREDDILDDIDISNES